MINKHAISLVCAIGMTFSYAQTKDNFQVQVIDATTKEALVSAHVTIGNTHTIVNNDGYFLMQLLEGEQVQLSISYVGYADYSNTITASTFNERVIALTPVSNALDEVVVVSDAQRELKKSAVTKIAISKDFLEQNRENSLMQSLKKIPGVSTITIGSGQSKPVIRGLGFNRVVVVQNGIKHEAQQWGADHGLEIDQFDVEAIEITKGAASLLYGSDAIAGVVSIKPGSMMAKNTFKGELNLQSQSNNDLYGVSLGVKQRFDNWYYKARITYKDFGDYKVPVNKIYYENYVFDLHNNQLRNTAGNTLNFSTTLGYVSSNFSSETFISNVNAKNGFFANAHGLEVRVSKIDYDKDNRDIDLPNHEVNHFKITNNTKFRVGNHKITAELGFQNNNRAEHSEPVPHGYMPKPNSTKERQFSKNTYALNLKDELTGFQDHNIAFGVNLEHQHNNIGGWGFLIPGYKRFTAGAFVYDKFKVSEEFYLEGGFRYDYGQVSTEAYSEWFLSPQTNANGMVTEGYNSRARNKTLTFGSYSASLGFSYLRDLTSYKLNIGKSFRIPLANELASDGVNYHMYRYEQGRLDLDPESSYEIDVEFTAKIGAVEFTASPFFNYFDNFIYLNPTASYYETLQKYQYTQSEVLRYGTELMLTYNPSKTFEATASLEYVRAKQLSGTKKNFTLPFSPPLAVVLSGSQTFKDWFFVHKPTFFADLRIAASQDLIVPPEKTTDGYTVLNAGFKSNLAFQKKHPLQFQLKVNNVFNNTFFDHTSFYRLIQVPEPGRNISISLIQSF